MQSSKLTEWGIWFSLLAGPTAWMIHLAIGYLIEEYACVVPRHSVMGFAPNVVMLAITIVALLVPVVATAVGISLVSRLPRKAAPPRLIFMSIGGLVSGLIFVLMMLTAATPLLFMGLCN